MNPKAYSDKTYICEKCHRSKRGVYFYSSNNKKYADRDGLLSICKDCATAFIDNWDSRTFLWILQECDVPWIPDEWNKLMLKYAKDPEKLTGSTIIGRYLGIMKLKHNREYRWKDTEFLMEIKKNEIQEAMRQSGYDERDIAKTIAQLNYEPPTDQDIPDEKDVLRDSSGALKCLPVQPPKKPGLEEEEGKDIAPVTSFISGGVISPEQVQEQHDSLNLTEEDIMYLRLKWGKAYKPDEWVWLEQFYEDMMNSYDIQTAAHIDTLKLICKTSLKSHQLMDIGDIEGAQKMVRTYNELMKSGNFTAAQNKSDGGDFVDSIGELVSMCEKDGYIERYYVDEPKDKVDFTIKDMQRYTRNLIMEETNLGNLIEQAIKQNAIEDHEDDDDNILIDYDDDDEKELTDEDFMEYNEFIEKQHEIDNEVI